MAMFGLKREGWSKLQHSEEAPRQVHDCVTQPIGLGLPRPMISRLEFRERSAARSQILLNIADVRVDC
jgi:hypothetical protein